MKKTRNDPARPAGAGPAAHSGWRHGRKKRLPERFLRLLTTTAALMFLVFAGSLFFESGDAVAHADSLQERGAVPVSISMQPTNAIAKKGESAVFSITADGEDYAYQWQARADSKEDWVNVSGEGSQTPQLSVNTEAVDGSSGSCCYRCLITDRAGNTVPSDTASLIVWSYDEETKTLTVSGRGTMPDWDRDGSKAPWHAASMTATTIIVQDGIENIGAYAFWDVGQFGDKVSIYIPGTVADISAHALTGWIKSIEVNGDNPVYCSKDGALFDKNGSALIQAPGGRGGRYIVPEGTSAIGDWAFEWCCYIWEIELPDGILSIGDYAFSNCKALNKLLLPEGLLSIGNHIFEPEAMIFSRPVISVPRSVAYIGENRFGGLFEKTEVYYSGTEEDWGKIDFAAPEGVTGNYVVYYLPDDRADTDAEHYPWFDYAGRWVSGQRSESTDNYWEEELTLRFTGSTSLVFSWRKSDVGELKDLCAEIDPETGIASFDEKLSLARNTGRGTITFKDGTVSLHIESSGQSENVPDGYEVTFKEKESDRLQSAKWFS